MGDPDAFLILTGPLGNRKIGLDQGGAWMIGRTSDHPVALADELVSRNHALIQCAYPGEFYLIDMGSRNGSYINGTRVGIPCRLADGDSIEIGRSTLIFHSRIPEGTERQPTVEDIDQTRTNFASCLLTVLVVDIRDFTRLAQQSEQKVLCEAIGTWFRLGGRIVQEHGSWTQKYIGDAIMSVWVHFSDRKNPQMLPILQAYLDLVDLTDNLGKQFEFPHPLRIGAGMNTGVAIIGNTGSATMSDFTAMGDSVNAAFRIESASKEIGADLVVGQSTYDQLRSLVLPEPYFQPHTVMLKGYDEPANVWAADLESVRSFLHAAATAPLS